MNDLFKNRIAVLASQHHKEKVIAPILEKELGIKVTVPPDFDTDIFGTEEQLFPNNLQFADPVQCLYCNP